MDTLVQKCILLHLCVLTSMLLQAKVVERNQGKLTMEGPQNCLGKLWVPTSNFAMWASHVVPNCSHTI